MTAAIALASSSASAETGCVAYLAHTDDYWQVWTMKPDGSRQRQVTRSPYEKTRISWFPDGRSLLTNSLAGTLYRVDIDTGAEETIPLPVSGMLDAVLSPDGRWIAFSLAEKGAPRQNDIWVVGIDGRGLRPLVTMPWLQHQPHWAPDGRTLYFLSGTSDARGHDLWRLMLDSGRRAQLTVGNSYNFEATSSPDGSTIALSSNRSGNYELWLQKDAGPARQLTEDPALDGGPAWAPDGTALIFHSTRSGTLQLWRLATDQGSPEQLTNHTGGARSPVWWGPELRS